MTDDLLTEYNLFIQTLRVFPKEWLKNYFDLLKRLLNDLGLTDDAPQLAMSVTTDNNLQVNIGQRWVTKPFSDNTIGLILPLEEDLVPLKCERIGYYTKSRMKDAQWVNYSFEKDLPPQLYTAWLAASKAEVEKVKTRSGYRKHHSSLFYQNVMNNDAREEIMRVAFEEREVVR